MAIRATLEYRARHPWLRAASWLLLAGSLTCAWFLTFSWPLLGCELFLMGTMATDLVRVKLEAAFWRAQLERKLEEQVGHVLLKANAALFADGDTRGTSPVEEMFTSAVDGDDAA